MYRHQRIQISIIYNVFSMAHAHPCLWIMNGWNAIISLLLSCLFPFFLSPLFLHPGSPWSELLHLPVLSNYGASPPPLNSFYFSAKSNMQFFLKASPFCMTSEGSGPKVLPVSHSVNNWGVLPLPAPLGFLKTKLKGWLKGNKNVFSCQFIFF